MMVRLSKALSITLLVLMTVVTLAPMASGKKKKVVIYYQTASTPDVWYEVYTEKQPTPPVYTYTVPGSTDKVYVYSAPAPAKEMGMVKVEVPAADTSIFIDGEYAGVSSNVARMALEAGSHDVELRDTDGKSVFKGSLDITAGGTTELKPDAKSDMK